MTGNLADRMRLMEVDYQRGRCNTGGKNVVRYAIVVGDSSEESGVLMGIQSGQAPEEALYFEALNGLDDSLEDSGISRSGIVGMYKSLYVDGMSRNSEEDTLFVMELAQTGQVGGGRNFVLYEDLELEKLDNE
jgi:hypothetical protein